jgi:hypothetical protein
LLAIPDAKQLLEILLTGAIALENIFISSGFCFITLPTWEGVGKRLGYINDHSNTPSRNRRDTSGITLYILVQLTEDFIVVVHANLLPTRLN